MRANCTAEWSIADIRAMLRLRRGEWVQSNPSEGRDAAGPATDGIHQEDDVQIVRRADDAPSQRA
jgi:hypothetical protein